MIDFAQSPSFFVPLRFFLVAPVFGMVAGGLMVLEPELFVSRWMPAMLALTHLLTLGVMLHLMLGALLQVLPVVAGVGPAQPDRLARWLLPLLSGGTLALVVGLGRQHPVWLGVGAGLLGLSLLGFLGALGGALLRAATTSPTLAGLKGALWIGLPVTGGLGGFLALGLVLGLAVDHARLTDLHAAWGLGVWGGLLLAAVAAVVVPMFQLTPPYPVRASVGWLRGVVLLGSLWGLALLFLSWTWLDAFCALGMVALGLAFVVQTLRLLRQRRRARPDTTLRYWQCGLASAGAGLLMFGLSRLWPALGDLPVWPVLAGILLIGGGFLSIMTGMLYKIVPFLAWMHLQQARPGTPVPPMTRLLPESEAQRQFGCQMLALLATLAAAGVPTVPGWPAGGLFVLAQGLLLWQLLQAVRRYRRALADGVGA